MKSNINKFLQVDSGYKLFTAVLLGIVPFLVHHSVSYVILSAYLLMLTFLYGARLKEMMKSMTAYLIIIIIPYTFGLLMAWAVSHVYGSELALVYGTYEDVALRLLQLFLLWYATSLFFFSSPTEELVGVFDRALTPLKKIGVRSEEFLTVIMCIVKELKYLGPGVKAGFSESAAAFSKKTSWKVKINVLSTILVSFIVDSFQRLDEVERYVANVKPEELFSYRPKFTIIDGVMFLSLAALLYTMLMVEMNRWFV
ncbi:hypothetical protein [Salisediminibacterium halotolerans]|uniref:Energy-coupling factor transport system permease protein n=1 Tax=Salisediminibacterium halotolerans TaxID=517425 RepID=A0A1H9T9W5_9BACI|nr:hypothetical protein [Salisediminibacterium haloalkalitolerans]SER93951.1 energy-coupling factor transport system permease protein [Salisediminibacterium haloalkalitolerans]